MTDTPIHIHHSDGTTEIDHISTSDHESIDDYFAEKYGWPKQTKWMKFKDRIRNFCMGIKIVFWRLLS